MTKILILLFLALIESASAQTKINDLFAEIEGRRVQLESVSGNGGSTGTVINGYLVNETATVN